MGEKLVIGPINKGLRKDRTAFAIDDDSFPQLINAYQWRGRVKRKRGTSLLTRLKRFIGTTNGAGNITVTIVPVPILTGISSFVIGTDVFYDQGGANPVTMLTNSSGTGVLNRTTGVLTITGSKINTPVFFFPTLPVMGLEDLTLDPTLFPGTVAFDTRYSYNILTSAPYTSYDIGFFKNPSINPAILPGYVPKATPTPFNWNGFDYQQFWSTNYQGALFVTNGIDIPFIGSNIGMQFKAVTAVTFIPGGPPAIATFTILNHGLVVGDFLFFNEFAITVINGLNFQTGYVIAVVDANNVTVEFPNAILTGPGGLTNTGIAQYLTNSSNPNLDCIKWYDGDPTNGDPNNPAPAQGKGWVNFCPPLSQSNFSISDLPLAQYYLVSARIILPFKDRLLAIGPVVQASSGLPKYLQDTVIFSQNGTPYYTASFQGDPRTPLESAGIFTVLAPINQTAFPAAWFEDTAGFGGFQQAAVDQPITTASANEDALIMGFSTLQARFLYTGNDILPFSFYIINSELGSSSTFSAINTDQGVITRGTRGFIISAQTNVRRIDLDILPQNFQIQNSNNGPERLCSQRDFINEWIYFTYLSDEVSYKFPNQTLQYNYRDDSWAIFNESYTTYGTFRQSTGDTWLTLGTPPGGYNSWNAWDVPWNSGESSLLEPKVIGGNQQGFILTRDEGTDEDPSLTIQNITGTTVTSPNHNLNEGDFIIIENCLGTIGSNVNGRMFQVASPDTDTFLLDSPVSAGTYQGGGTITRFYVPQIQTKQFPMAWGIGRKTRLGPQQYLLTTTANGQIQLLIFLSQNSTEAYNTGNIVPDLNTVNNSLIYSTILYTCPEATNLGLTPANINLQIPTAILQDQTWHRVNTSLIGDTVQIGFTISDDQMLSLTASTIGTAITGATKANPCVLTCTGQFEPNQLIQITGVVGMTQLNYSPVSNNFYSVITSDATTVTINVDSSAFDNYVSGGLATPFDYTNHTSEIELHSIILDVSPSQVLV